MFRGRVNHGNLEGQSECLWVGLQLGGHCYRDAMSYQEQRHHPIAFLQGFADFETNS